MPPRPESNFLTTQWTRILGSQRTSTGNHSEALTILCNHYRQPVYLFILRKTGNVEDAEDLTQSFFAFLIEKKGYRHADPKQGKFRTFLLASVKNFLLQEHRNQNRQKRGGLLEHVSLDNPDTGPIPDYNGTPTDTYFDHEWAINVFDTAWKLLQKEYAQAGQEQRFHLLRDTLTLPDQAIPYPELAERMNLSLNGAKSATFRMRSRFRDLFRAVVAQVVENPAEVDAEIRHLMEVLIKNPQNQSKEAG